MELNELNNIIDDIYESPEQEVEMCESPININEPTEENSKIDFLDEIVEGKTFDENDGKVILEFKDIHISKITKKKYIELARTLIRDRLNSMKSVRVRFGEFTSNAQMVVVIKEELEALGVNFYNSKTLLIALSNMGIHKLFICELCNISAPTFYKILNGRSKLPPKSFEKLIILFDIDMEALNE